MTEPDFSKMTSREILMWEIKNAKTQVVKIDTVEIEEEVWESTLRVSMERAAEIEKLKEQLKLAIKGLQYYANEDIYIECHQIVNGKNEWMSEVMVDCGVKADYVLKKIKELGYDKKA